jgi:hypothetical protein
MSTTDDNAPLSYDEQELNYFGYIPSKDGATFFIVMFGLVTLIAFYMTCKYPKAKYMYELPFSAGIECIGYLTRLATAYKPATGTDVISVLFILLAPIVLALINYITVGRLIEPTGKNMACIKPTSISRVFFASDFLGLIVQGAGGSILASADTQSAYTLGSNIILVFFFLCTQVKLQK